MSLASFLSFASIVLYSYYSHTFSKSCLVGLLIDKSVFRGPNEEVVIQSISQLFAEQAKIKGIGSLTLAEFSDRFYTVVEADLQKVNPNYKYSYDAGGGRCLYNSIMQMTSLFEKKISKMENKPQKVLINIMTDGMDTDCGTTADQIKKLVQKKTAEGWEYLFFGALPNTLEQAESLGLPKEQAAFFSTDNIQGSIGMISQKITQLRKGRKLAITDGERVKLALPAAPANKIEL